MSLKFPKKYSETSVQQLDEVVVDTNVADNAVNPVTVRSEKEIELEEMISDLLINDPLILRILTILPKTWSANKISEEFSCSW